MDDAFDLNRSMIFNPLIVVASQLGLGRSMPSAEPVRGETQIVRAFRTVKASGIGSVIVDSVTDAEEASASACGAYTVRTDLDDFDTHHNYRSQSGAERIAATVNRFDRYYTHDVVVAVADDLPELRSFYLQALMYALACSEVGVACLVSPLADGDLEDTGLVKAAVDWNNGRRVHPVEGGRVGTLVDLRRDASALPTQDLYKLVPVHAWRRGALDRLVDMPPCERELDEGTDLVRALDSGIRIGVSLVWDDMTVLITPQEVRGDEIEG